MSFAALDGDLLAAAADGQPRAGSTSPAGCTSRCPSEHGGPDVEAVYEDVGELDAGSLAGLKALYSDARKRAGVAAGIGAYLYTALAAVVLPIGPGARQVQCIRRAGQERPAAALPRDRAWLRDGYRARMSTEAVRARPRPDPRPRRTRRRHGPGREHRRRRRPHATSARRHRHPAAATRRRQRQRRTATASWSRSTSAASAPPRRPRHDPARDRLAALAAAAGYGPDALALIADAALPATGPANGSTTAARARRQRRRGARPGGTRPSALPELVAHYRAATASRWREHFWRAPAAHRRLRFSHPRFYGLSPCEADPARLAATARRRRGPAARSRGRLTLVERTPMSALAAPAAPAAARRPAPSSPPASRSRAGCPSATTASRCATSRTPPTRKFLLCPDDWRRHYLKGERTPPSGRMFLGAPRRRRPLHLLPPPARARRHAHARPAPATPTATTGRASSPPSRPSAASTGTTSSTSRRAFTMGLQALDAHASPSSSRCSAGRSPSSASSSTRSRPAWSGRSRASSTSRRCAQRRAAASRCPRSSTTRSRAPCTPRPRPTTTRRPASTSPAAGSPAQPAEQFCFAQIGKPGKQRKTMSTAFVVTRRTVRAAARDARADRAGRQPDRRALRALRARRAVGVRRPERLEVLAALLRATTPRCPGGGGL